VLAYLVRNQNGKVVMSFRSSFLIRRRSPAGDGALR
jgi:hypothetical protein